MNDRATRRGALVQRIDGLIRHRLWAQIILALLLGVGAGVALGPDAGLISREQADLIGLWAALPGELFLAVVAMVIIPLAAASIVLGVANSELTRLQSLGLRLIVFVVCTTLAAGAIGAWLSQWLQPGAGLAPADAPVRTTPEAGLFEELPRQLPSLIVSFVPRDVLAAMLERDMLAVIVFALLIGLALARAERAELVRPLIALAEAVQEIALTIVRYAMQLAPLAVFGLIAQVLMTSGAAALVGMAAYVGVVLAGLACLLALYLGLVALLGGMGPAKFLSAVGPVQLLAFSTSSSAAVMPLSTQTAVEKLGATAQAAEAIVPLGATMNMAGTALYQACAVAFLAQAAGAPLGVSEFGALIVTLTAASIGAPAAPGASVAILSTVAASFGVPLTALPLVMGVDRLLDMARTAVNVTGDLAACRIFGRA